MFTLRTLVDRLLRRTRPSARPASAPDSMSLREWADLPSYHPICDGVPR